MIAAACQVCGEGFEIPNAWARKPHRGRYCSRRCMGVAQRRLPPRRKICTKCREDKPIEDFYPRSDRPGKFKPHCKECFKNRQRVRQIRRHSRMRRLDGKITEIDRLRVHREHNGICGICLEPVPVEAFHVDHKVPLARGGEHSYENVQPAHPFCNGSKGSGRKKSTKKKGR